MADRSRRWRVFTFGWWRRQLGAGRVAGLIVMVAMLGLRVLDPVLLEEVRNKTFDFYQTLRPRPADPNHIVSVVDLDEDSLKAIGQWPWPRNIIAQMVSNLIDAGAIVIGFDIYFAESDRMNPASVAQTLPGLDDETRKRLEALPSNDAILAQAMQKGQVVVGQTGIPYEARRVDKIPNIPTIAVIGPNPIPFLDTYTSILRNTPEIDFAAKGWGVVTFRPETDGVVRRVPAIVTDGKALYPALSLEMLRVGLGNESLAIKTDEQSGGVQFVKVSQPGGAVAVPTDGNGRIWVYAGRYDPGKYIPAKDVISGKFDPARVNGKLILVGTSAAGLQDIRAIATERQIPGVDVHAQMIETILNKQMLSYPPVAPSIEWIMAAIGGLLMVVLVPLVGARWTLLLFLVGAAGMAAFSWLQFTEKLTLYDPVFPIATTLLTFIIVTYASYAREEAQKRQVRTAMSRYLSPELTEQVAADPSRLKLGGETRDMTLLFCDIRGFTTISEQFDAQGLTQLINKFLTPMTEIIRARKGTIDKYMGDCIMAFWNAPLDVPDHAARACESALAMNGRLGPLNDELEADAKANNRKHVPIKIGIGLNSGPVVVGNMGSDQRFDYSCLGDNVNLASRLEGQSKGYGVLIVIGENTFQRAPDYAALELDLIKVKGKTEAVRIYTVVGMPDTAQSPEYKTLKVEHDAFLAAYRAQEWTQARDMIENCKELAAPYHTEHYYDIIAERIDEYEQNPPGAGWDGVYTATSK